MSAEVTSIAEALSEIEQGNLLIICDHPERENEGDFFIAAEKITIAALNIMIQRGRGLVCCPITPAIAARLELGPQTAHNTSLHHTQFTVSVDSARCAGSGIPSADRADTIAALAHPSTTARDLVRPGHIFPIVSHARGITARAGHTEAAVALLALANLQPVGVICEIISDNGEMAHTEQLEILAKELEIKIVHVQDIQEHCRGVQKGGGYE